MKITTKDMIRIAVAISLIAIGARIQIPSPLAGYFTLQLPAVFITGILLGKRNACLAIGVYILGGLLGIPWFAGGGGLAYILKPTFGFLLSFIPAAYLMAMTRQAGHLKSILIATLAVLVIWLIGMVYLTAINTLHLGKEGSYISAVLSIVSLDLLFDFALAYVSLIIGKRVAKGLDI